MKKMNCLFCDNPQSEYLRHKIKDGKYWSVYLWKYPYHLGRCFIKLNRHAEDILDINEDERRELFEISRKLRNALKKSFGADMINYAALGNEVRHVHLHVIPRYSKKVVFEEITFEDGRWGKNYAPYDKKFNVPEEIMEKIAEEIKINLK